MNATPQRPVPGAFFATPAPVQPNPLASRPPAFRMPSNPSLQRQQQQQPGGAVQPGAAQPGSSAEPRTELEDAANMISIWLADDQKFPAMEDYISQGASSDYKMTTSTPYAPFDKIKSYDIPDRIFQTFENSHLSTHMGLFQEIHHAWAAVDNALYIWDYTHPNPELAGLDDFTSNIVAVTLAKPKKDTFRPGVNYVLLVATAKDLHILAVEAKAGLQDVISVELYQTDMKIPMSNMAAECIASCQDTGRIFVGCSNSNAIYEMHYQNEERWFSSKCAKVNQTEALPQRLISENLSWTQGWYPFTASNPEHEYSVQIEIDETRKLLYVLSNQSNIRVFSLSTDGSLSLVISKTKQNLLSDIAHVVQRSSLFGDLKVVSISPVTKTESSRIALVATTSLGVRLYLSATSSIRLYPTRDEADPPPSSMQVHHVRFPPGPSPNSRPPQSNGSLVTVGTGRVNTESLFLKNTFCAARYSPGSHFFLMSPTADTYMIFISTPDSAALGNLRSTPSAVPSFIESTITTPRASGRAIAIGLTTPSFAAANSPIGFGNEMAVQFDHPTVEVAVLTNTGVHIYRRRRLVDSFAALLFSSTTEESFETNVKQFITKYSRIETCASALAVVCGQATDAGIDSGRSNAIANPEVIELARRTFIEHGGKPDIREYMDSNQVETDSVRHSARTKALILYTGRLVRSLWQKPILKRIINGGIVEYTGSTVPLSKLQKVSQDLINLKEFLNRNKSFISGLSGPEELTKAGSTDEQLSIQWENRELTRQIKTLSNMIEGNAFLTQFFDQPFLEILAALPSGIRDDFGKLTYDRLFTSRTGKLLAKEVVKAIVNRSIEAGSSIDSVADSLRRRCGSFCSADDVITFKAQELLQKSLEAGAETTKGRELLNNSLKQFKKVANALTPQYLEAVVSQYLSMSFYAGAISLCLDVANEKDRGKQALAWIRDGQPANDSRVAEFRSRTTCYNQIWRVIQTVDALPAADPATAQRKQEAYGVIDLSEDEVFQNCLYDWYLAQNQSQRLMDLNSPFVIAYLERKAATEKEAADLLWHYHVHHHQHFEAAKTQLQLAKSSFDINLNERLDYLSRAKANASTRVPTFGRLGGSKQEMVRTISDLLDCANVQLDLLHRLQTDPRLPEQNRANVQAKLNNGIESLSDLYNAYAQPAEFYDICLVIFHLSDHWNGPEIMATWRNYVSDAYRNAVANNEPEPLSVVIEKIRSVALRVELEEPIFSANYVLTVMIEQIYSIDPNASLEVVMLPVDLLLDLSVPFENILNALTEMLFTSTVEWPASRRRTVGSILLAVSKKWAQDTSSGVGVPFGSEENAAAILEALRAMAEGGLVLEKDGRGLRELVLYIERSFA